MGRTTRGWVCGAVTAACVAGFGAAGANASHIDTIATNESHLFFNVFSDSIVTVTNLGSPSNVLGGERYVESRIMSGTDASVLTVSKLPGTGILNFASTVEATGMLLLEYGRNTPLNADFATLYNAIQVDFTGVDGQASLAVTLMSGPNSGTVTHALTAAGPALFAFNEAGFAGVNFGDVDKVSVKLTGTTPGADFSIASITLVPEPAMLVMAGLSGVGLLMFRRRRRSV